MKKIIKSAVVLCFASALFGDVKSMHPDFDVESQQLMADLEEWQREFDQICDLLARPLGTQPEVTDEEYAKFSEDIANEDADEAYAAILDPNEVCKWISDSDRLDFISDPHYNREIGKLWADLFVSDPSSAVALELRKSIAKNLREYSQLENQRIEEVKDILKQNYAILGGGFEGEMSVTVGNNAYRISVDRLFSRLYDTDDYNHIENKENNLNIRNRLNQLLDTIRNGNGVQGALANLGNAIRTLNQYEIDQTPARKDALSNYSNKDQEITVDGIVHRVSLDELFETIKTNNSEASIRLGNKLTALADVLIRYKGGHFLFGSKRLRDEVVEAYRLYVQEQQRQQPVEH